MVVFVCFFNLNLLCVIMFLKLVCNTIVVDLLVIKDFLAMYRWKFFWNFRVVVLIISFLCIVWVILFVIRKKIFNIFKLLVIIINRKREEMSK